MSLSGNMFESYEAKNLSSCHWTMPKDPRNKAIYNCYMSFPVCIRIESGACRLCSNGLVRLRPVRDFSR
jgi:hypothetical protein